MAIGASKINNILARAVAAFPEGQPSPDQLVRSRQLAAAGDIADKLFDDLTDEYYAVYETDPAQDSHAEWLRSFWTRDLPMRQVNEDCCVACVSGQSK